MIKKNIDIHECIELHECIKMHIVNFIYRPTLIQDSIIYKINLAV